MDVLYLLSRTRFETKMSRGRFQHMAAVSRHPDVDRFAMWGNGFPHYVESETVTQNIKRLGWMPDVVHVYKPEDHRGVDRWDGLKSVAYNEAWWPNGRALAEVRASRIQIVIHHHENDAHQFDGHDGIVRHIPHCADAGIFAGGRHPVKDINALLTGVSSPEIYPLRAKYKHIPGVTHRRHMGGLRFHSQQSSYRSSSLERAQSQFDDYAEQLRRAKLSLCCTSRYKYALEKLVQSAMAGCVIMTDLPDDSDFCNSFADLVVEVCSDMNESEIAQTIAYVLSDSSGVRQRADEIRDVALTHYTMESYADRYVQCVADCH